MDSLVSQHFRWLRQAIFWLAVWIFYIFFFSYSANNYLLPITLATALLPITLLVSFTFTKYLIPKFLLQNRLLQFGIYSITTILFCLIAVLLLLLGLVAYIPTLNMAALPPMGKNYLFISILIFTIVLLVSFFKIWKINLITTSKAEQKLLQMKYQNKEQELRFLQSQINPHFLFNALNTIYGYALKQSAETPDIILNLSNLLDYTLYRVNKPSTPLKDEWQHIEQYIALEKIRFEDTLELDLQTQIIDNDIQIAPLTILPFVENAFKHGSIAEGKLKIQIRLKADEQETIFSICNFCNTTSFDPRIGLSNTQKRLKLHYPNQHHLDIKIEDGLFKVTLIIAHKPK